MEKETVSVLQSVMRYEFRGCIICCVLLAICIIGILFAVLRRRRKNSAIIGKIIAYGTILLFVVVGVLYIVQVKVECEKIQNDITKSQYVTYEGTFIHDDYQKDSFYHNVYITDSSGERIRLRLPDYANTYDTHTNYQQIPFGECTGTLVYSKESKLIVKWCVMEDTQ